MSLIYIDTKEISNMGLEDAITDHAIECIESPNLKWQMFQNFMFLETYIQKKKGNLSYRIHLLIKGIENPKIFMAEFLDIELLKPKIEKTKYKIKIPKSKKKNEKK